MGFFYFDESIHDRDGFIVGAYVYSQEDLAPSIDAALASVGLKPGVDEFKSSNRMDTDDHNHALRSKLRELLYRAKVAVVVTPREDRHRLGDEALLGLYKIIQVNNLSALRHSVYFDQNIGFENREAILRDLSLRDLCDFHFDQRSHDVLGLQLADLTAHTCSIMLKGQLGTSSKLIQVGKEKGYVPDIEIPIWYEMWASVRTQFFTQDGIDIDEEDIDEAWTLNTGAYALHVSGSCPSKLRAAAEDRFGRMYIGCIH